MYSNLQPLEVRGLIGAGPHGGPVAALAGHLHALLAGRRRARRRVAGGVAGVAARLTDLSARLTTTEWNKIQNHANIVEPCLAKN